ncbi:unnamed protein product [Lampetra planeri]
MGRDCPWLECALLLAVLFRGCLAQTKAPPLPPEWKTFCDPGSAHKCTCDYKSRKVDCQGKTLSSVPSGIPADTALGGGGWSLLRSREWMMGDALGGVCSKAVRDIKKEGNLLACPTFPPYVSEVEMPNPKSSVTPSTSTKETGIEAQTAVFEFCHDLSRYGPLGVCAAHVLITCVLLYIIYHFKGLHSAFD